MTVEGMTRPDITLALPTYNESANIVGVLDESIVALEKIGRTFEVIVIDNFSSDNTTTVVQDYIRRTSAPVRLIVHPQNRLYSGSCETALREASGTYIAIMDSDGQFTAADLPRFIADLDRGANLVFGWRRKRHDPTFRLVASFVFKLMGKIWLHYPFHDLNVGLRMFDRKFVEIATIKHRINLSNPEFYARAKIAGLQIGEVEITHAERRGGVTSHDLGRSFAIFLMVNRHMRALGAEMKRGRVG